ncbi:MAG TPA: antibiotic biosynthesis monooxygenase family protein [Streptosporangiaceae bacterium]
MSAGIFRVMLRMQTLPRREAEFEQAWLDGAKLIAAEPANLGQWLCRSSGEDDVYYIVSDWTDEDAFRAYETSQRHVEHRSRLHPFRASGSMALMSVICELTGSGMRA